MRVSVLIFIVLSVFYKESAASPTVCGYLPAKIHSCVGSPQLVNPDIASKCSNTDSECARMTCIYKKSGWLKNTVVDKQKISKHIDDYGKEHPEWLVAVEHAKSECIQPDLPSQGIHINCPAYDITECIFTTFVKHAQPEQWSSSSECQYPRQFAAACPFCPSDCFAPLIPIGACNACISLPRSP